MILGVSQTTANEVVQGELGWWTVKARLDFLRLVYFGKLTREREGVVCSVFREAREKADRGQKGWGLYTKQLMRDLGLEEEWVVGEVGDLRRWREKVKDKIQDREWRQWRAGMVGKVTLDRYRRIKTRLKAETFLKRNRAGVRRLIRLRVGTERLQIVRGRHRGVKREERRCLVCCSGAVEDEEHFIEECDGIDDERRDMWDRIYDLVHDHMKMRLDDMNKEEIVDWFLGSEVQRRE